jgi:hypothetical protein
MRPTVSFRAFFSGCLALALVALMFVRRRPIQRSQRQARFGAAPRPAVVRRPHHRSQATLTSACGRGVAGRKLDNGAQVGEVDNIVLTTVASDPRVERVMVDRPAFATMERTGSIRRDAARSYTESPASRRDRRPESPPTTTT